MCGIIALVDQCDSCLQIHLVAGKWLVDAVLRSKLVLNISNNMKVLSVLRLSFARVGMCLLVGVHARVRACPSLLCLVYCGWHCSWHCAHEVVRLSNSCARAHADISLELLLLISVVPALFALLLVCLVSLCLGRKLHFITLFMCLL